MNEYMKKLRDKWGEFVKRGNYISNGLMPFISNEARLNVLFVPKSIEEMSKYYKDVLNAELHRELNEIYEWTNGCRLFFGSLAIYGIRDENNDDILTPFDLEWENKNLSDKMNTDKYIFFGSIGGEFVFGYDKHNPSEVYGMKVGDGTVLQKFDGVKDFFGHYFYALMEEYDIDCRKIHPTEAYKGIPVLENKCIELI